MASDQPSLPERVESSYRKLSSVASELNFVSDELGKYVSEMDSALKNLNLGVGVWVVIKSDDLDNGTYESDELGYKKIDGKWGIALKTEKGHYAFPEEVSVAEWLFNDAPRSLRLSAIKKIPELLEQLSEEASKVAAEINANLSEVHEVAAVLQKAAAEPVRRIVARGLTRPEQKK